MDEKISPHQVSQAVRDFWKAFANSAGTELSAFYAPDASVFGVEGPRSELVRLALARRQREYFDRHARLNVELGMIDVRLLNEYTAVATYTFTFRASNVSGASGKTQDRHIEHGRATQLFQMESGGKPVIVHEHLSSADIRK